MWLIHISALSLYCWWTLCDIVESYKTKIWDFETKMYFVNFVYQIQEWTFMELKGVLSLPALSRALHFQDYMVTGLQLLTDINFAEGKKI